MKKTNCKNILLVEDDEPIRETLQELLESEGYQVLTAGNGKEAIEVLESQKILPGLILLDLMMPILNGFQFLEQMKQNHPDMLATIPVVVVSAAGDGVVNRAKKETAGFVRKPINLDFLLQTVQKFCGVAGFQ